jgi:hypothetical protein
LRLLDGLCCWRRNCITLSQREFDIRPLLQGRFGHDQSPTEAGGENDKGCPIPAKNAFVLVAIFENLQSGIERAVEWLISGPRSHGQQPARSNCSFLANGTNPARPCWVSGRTAHAALDSSSCSSSEYIVDPVACSSLHVLPAACRLKGVANGRVITEKIDGWRIG